MPNNINHGLQPEQTDYLSFFKHPIVSALLVSLIVNSVAFVVNYSVLNERVENIRQDIDDSKIRFKMGLDDLNTRHTELEARARLFRDEQVRNTERGLDLDKRIDKLEAEHRSVERRYGEDWWKDKKK